MWSKAKVPSSESDPLVSTRAELEALRIQLAGEMEDRKIEMERFKEETLWRLNSLSDRTVEIAHMEERDIEARIAQDKEETEAKLGLWKTRVRERVMDEKFLDALVEQAIHQLLPMLPAASPPAESENPNGSLNESRKAKGGDTCDHAYGESRLVGGPE
jgi:hypothetical protein